MADEDDASQLMKLAGLLEAAAAAVKDLETSGQAVLTILQADGKRQRKGRDPPGPRKKRLAYTFKQDALRNDRRCRAWTRLTLSQLEALATATEPPAADYHSSRGPRSMLTWKEKVGALLVLMAHGERPGSV